jgi:hypothetical protein
MATEVEAAVVEVVAAAVSMTVLVSHAQNLKSRSMLKIFAKLLT